MTRETIIQKAGAALDRHTHILFAYLFGSVASGRQHPFSDIDIDIDIAVYLKDGTDYTEEKLSILGSLMDELHTDAIDLVICNTAPLTLQARIIRHKEILIDRQPHLRHRFESLVMQKYFDFAPFEEAILSRRFSVGR